MSDDKEREDYDALLKSPGWLRFKNFQTRRWRDEYDSYVEKAANDADDSSAMSKMRQIIAARKAVLASLDYPEDRIRQLDDAARTRTLQETVPLSRRGSL